VLSRRPPEGLTHRVKGALTHLIPSRAPLTRRGRALPDRRDSTRAHRLKKDPPHDHLDIFGHLMTPEQHQTTEDSQRSGSGKSEVIACINNQLKQRSENQRVRGSSPRRPSELTRSIALACHP
jgi:hypothetical protein